MLTYCASWKDNTCDLCDGSSLRIPKVEMFLFLQALLCGSMQVLKLLTAICLLIKWFFPSFLHY